MANLLDESSIVLTPTAYDDGKVLCVIPKAPPYGDFDFSRNSSATRINAQGLVEDVQILSGDLVQNGDFSEIGTEEVLNGDFSEEGAEEVSNGDFSNGSTDWILGTGWSISNEKLNATNVNSTSATQSISSFIGKSFKVVYTISNYSQGDVRIFLGGAQQTLNRSENGTFTEYITITSGNSTLYVQGVNNFTGSITNISVKEVAQNWVFSSGAFLTDIGARLTHTPTAGTVVSVGYSPLVVGNNYKMTYEITQSVSGGIKLNSAVIPTMVSTVGVHTKYFEADNNIISLSRTTPSGNDVTITNISVKEVGQNWSFGDGFTPDEVNSKATCDGTQTAATNLQQTITTNIQNQLVRVSFTLDYTAGLLLGSLSGTGAVDFTNITSSGTYTADMTSNEVSPILTLQGDASFIGSITDVIIKSVTNDTNLPRINYEGFSYQDALGSELVTGDNSNFDTSLGNWQQFRGVSVWDSLLKAGKWTDNGTTGSPKGFTMSGGVIPTSANTSYILEFKAKSNTTDTINFNRIGEANNDFTATSNPNLTSDFQNYKFIVNTSLANQRLYVGFDATSFNNGESYWIDNVSVKEYLGQEVVPDSGCGSWLFEPQSTNLAPYSESLVNWLNSGGNTLTSGLTSPSGDNSAYSILSGTGSSSRLVLITNLVALETKHTLSAFVKQVDSFNTAYLRWGSSELAANIVTFAFDTETLTNVSGNTTDLFVETFQNGWYRIGFTFTTGASITSQAIQINRGASVTASYWGAMLEEQSYATSYIPTEGTTKTRNQDLCTNGGDVSLISSTEGTLYAEIAKRQEDNDNFILISLNNAASNSDADSVTIGFNNNTNFYIRVKSNGNISFIEQTIASNKNQFYKVALKYKSGNISAFIDGVNVASNTTSFSFGVVLDNLSFDYNGNSSLPFFGKTKCLAVWKEALSDQELADLTYPTPTDPTFTLDFDTIAEQFTFARGSEATYVDAQGLIQSTNEIGEELITNGDFSNGLTNWTTYGITSVSNGVAIIGANANSGIYQSILSQSKSYKVTINVTAYNGVGQAQVVNNTGFVLYTINAVGEHTFTFEHTIPQTNLIIRGLSNALLSIDNVSAKEYTTATNTPRLDYSTGAEAFLLEPQSTNLITYSEDLSDASWNKQNGGTASIPSITANYGISPDGTQNASRVIFDLNGGTTSSDFSQLQNNITATVGNDYTSSVYMKSNDSNTYDVTFVDVNGGTNIVSVTPQWQRFIISAVLSAANMRIRTRGSEGSSDVTDVLIWGAQVEQQSYATSYIPTSGTTVTRNQETCTDATPEINSEEGVLYAEISALADSTTQRYITLSDGTSANDVRLYLSSGGHISVLSKVGGITQVYLQSNAYPQTDFNKVAFKYKENDFALWINGTEVDTDTSGLVNAPNTLNELAFDGNGLKFFGNTKDLQVYTKALSDAELIKLTQ